MLLHRLIDNKYTQFVQLQRVEVYFPQRSPTPDIPNMCVYVRVLKNGRLT